MLHTVYDKVETPAKVCVSKAMQFLLCYTISHHKMALLLDGLGLGSSEVGTGIET